MKKNLKKKLKKVKKLPLLRNYGLQILPPKQTDYVLGGLTKLPKTVLQPTGQWDAFLPLPEFQALGVETMACTCFGTLSAVEVLIKRLFGNEKNFSDRWLAQKAKISPSGADPHAVAEVLRNHDDSACPYQSRWDYTVQQNTWDLFYQNPPEEVSQFATKDFEYVFSHEYVPSTIEAIKEALTYSPLGVSVAAWIPNGDVYFKPEGARDNHWCVAYGWTEKNGRFLLKIFDSYDNTTKLYDGMPLIIKRYHLAKKTSKPKLTWLQLICRFFGKKV